MLPTAALNLCLTEHEMQYIFVRHSWRARNLSPFVTELGFIFLDTLADEALKLK